MRRRLSNCGIEALRLWLPSLWSKVRRYAWARQSTSFKGVILHAGIAQGINWKTLVVVEAIPVKKELGTRRNMLVLFRCRYRVWRFRLNTVKHFDTLEEAMEFAGIGWRS